MLICYFSSFSGLGGNPAIAGRAADLKQYIKVGYKHAYIEIELYNSDGNIIIERKFAANGDSRFSCNGKITSLKNIEKIVKKFHIQIDNLCQILPQEKLEHFAKMNDHERLVGTLKTVGNPKLSEWLEHLKASKQTEAIVRQKLITLKNDFNQAIVKKDSMELEAKAIKEKDFLIECLKLLKQRKIWQYYFHMKQAVNIVNDLLKSKLVVYQNMRDVLKRTMNEIQTSYTNVNNARVVSKKTNDQLMKLIRETKKKQNEINILTEKIVDIKAEFRQKETRFRSQEADIKILETKIQKIKDDILNVSQLEQEISITRRRVEEEENKVRKIVHEKDMKAHSLEMKHNEMNVYAHKLSKLNDVKEIKMKMLQQHFEDSYKGLLWLEENRNLFSGQVYGPMFLYLNVPDSSKAKYVEMCIGVKDLIAFMCEQRNDTTILVKELREKQKLRISVVSAVQNVTEHDLHPPFPIESIQKYGFEAFVKDFIEGPDIIIQYLTLNYHLNRIPVGNRHTYSVTSAIPSNISTFFTDKFRFSTSVAQLTNQKIESSREITEARFLSASVNVNELHELNVSYDKLAAEVKALEAEYKKLADEASVGDDRLRELRKEVKKLVDCKIAQSRLEDSLKVKIRELHRTKNAIIDLDLEKNKCSLAVKCTLAKICNMYIELGDLFKFLFESFVRYRQDKINEEQAEKVHSKNMQVTAEFVKSMKKEVGSLRKLEIKKRRLLQFTSAIHDWALKCTSRIDPRHPSFKRRKLFFTLTENVVILSRLINKFQAKINCLGGGNDGLEIFRAYKTLVKEINHLEKKIANKEEKLNAYYEKLDQIKHTWLSEVIALVKTINDNFRKFFELMGCVGEVCLYQGEEGAEEDFSRYGIHIKVKFRKEGELQILNAQIQSGGERAVSVAIYLLSLQELTTVPFRCIDEINQGMDANNERRIFNLITKATEEKGNTQYFLLTPKLLPNLNFTSHCKIFCPYNGVGSIPHDKVSQRLQRRSF